MPSQGTAAADIARPFCRGSAITFPHLVKDGLRAQKGAPS
ncbi:MAG: hypothetical protein QOK11_1958, partial [Pseudonocardiales bacterium]|nr:hypothetical protein [Pseudonocardiales bacterium]